MPLRRVNEIVHGKRAVIADTALRLARYFGTAPRFRFSLQAQYDLERAPDRLGDRLGNEVTARAGWRRVWGGGATRTVHVRTAQEPIVPKLLRRKTRRPRRSRTASVEATSTVPLFRVRRPSMPGHSLTASVAPRTRPATADVVSSGTLSSREPSSTRSSGGSGCVPNASRSGWSG